MTVHPGGLYLTRTGKRVGIVGPAPGRAQRFRWITTAGYYVTQDGRAALRGQCAADLVRDVSAGA